MNASAIPYQGRKRRGNEINIVPLVDVLIVLIFFFLMTMQFRNLSALNLTLPKIETAGENRLQDHMKVAVDADGAYFLNSQPVTEDELLAAFHLAGSLNSQQSVLLMADERTPLRYVAFIMDVCRREGLEKVRLQAR